MSALISAWWRLVRFGFRLLYNEFAWTYDIVSWGVSLGHWRRWQRAAIPHLETTESSQILELAHGTANLQIEMARRGIGSVGLDLSLNMGRIAQRKMRSRGLPPKLVRGNAMQLPFRANLFDCVVSTFPTEFIVHRDTLSEVYRVLKPRGRLVFVPNGMLELGNPVTRLLEWLYQITGQRDSWPTDPLAAFRRAGFDAELIEEELRGSKVWIIKAIKPTSEARR